MTTVDFKDFKANVQKLDPQPGEIFLINLERRYPSMAIQRMLAIWEELASSDSRLIVLEGGMQITKLDDEQLANLGLKRLKAETKPEDAPTVLEHE